MREDFQDVEVFLTPCFEVFDMRFKDEFYIPNQTKTFSFFYKLNGVVVQFLFLEMVKPFLSPFF